MVACLPDPSFGGIPSDAGPAARNTSALALDTVIECRTLRSVLAPQILVLSLSLATLLLTAGIGFRALTAGASGVVVTPKALTGIAGWTKISSNTENTLYAGEGVTTVAESGHSPYELYRGLASVPSNFKSEGWAHIGDPDSANGYIFDAYQGPSSGHSKMFLVTTPSGQSFEYLHRLVRGELYNNSFVAISPNRQWMIAGEWGMMSHLQIYPTPLLNHGTSSRGGSLRLGGYVKLDHMVNDVQGCDFVTSVKLICASDDDSRTLFRNEKPLVEVDLPTSLQGGSVTGHVVDLGSIPQESSCSGTFEAEGIDYDVSTGILRVEIIQPGSCILTTTVYEYKRS